MSEDMDIICDFCSSPKVTWRYPARNILMTDIQALSVGDWAACDTCHDIIERDGQPGITARTVETFKHNLPGMDNFILRLHKRFFAERTGPAERIGDTPSTPPKL